VWTCHYLLTNSEEYLCSSFPYKDKVKNVFYHNTLTSSTQNGIGSCVTTENVQKVII